VDEAELITDAFTPTRVGPYWDAIDAPSWIDKDAHIRLGVRNESFQIARRTGTSVAQYFHIVRFGLVRAVHLFRGMNRDMKVRDDMKAGERVLAYVWRPEFDFEWVGGPNSRAFPRKLTPPPLLVFVVLVRPFDVPDQYGVSGSILRWNWVDGDFRNAPIDHEDRYDKPVWSKNV